MSGNDLGQPPPEATQIEITVIGPSFGESICIHPGGGRWWIIDSCLDPHTKLPAAAQYLLGLGVDLQRQVDLLVATHWHDDHCGGLCRLLEQCVNAKFCLSSALTRDEFHTLVCQYQSNPPAATGSRLREFAAVFNTLSNTQRAGRRANQGRVLCRLESAQSGHGRECIVTSISPSDHAEQAFIDQVSTLLPKALDPKRPAPSLRPNEASVALWIEIGDIRVMLGADLENGADSRRGWQAYLVADNCPPGRAVFIKVPHHGSSNAYNEQMWLQRLESNPIVITTPWELGGRALPTQDDVARLQSISRTALITATPIRRRVPRREAPVMRQIRESGITLRPIPEGLGAVRCRTTPGRANGTWCIELFGSARAL